MEKKMLYVFISMLTIWLMLAINTSAAVKPMNLNDFSGDHIFINAPGTRVSMSGGGVFSHEFAVPFNGTALNFDYLFFNGFHDSIRSTAWLQGSSDNVWGLFETPTAGIGHVSWDLNGQPERASTAGLALAVSAVRNLFDFSVSKIADLRLQLDETVPVSDSTKSVPEPSTLLLLGTSIVVLAGTYRHKVRRNG